MATNIHPTDAERFFFDNNGFLILEDFLSADQVTALSAALERVIERRRAPDFTREHQPAFDDRLDSANVRVMHLLAEDPLFLQLLDYPPMLDYVHGLFNEMPHLHSTDAFYEVEQDSYHGRGWHIDGIQGGFRNLKPHIPLVQFKVGYYLSDMGEPDQGNLTLVPGSHKAFLDPDAEDLQKPELFPGALQVCGGPGTAVLFHNAVWHTAGPFTREGGKRVMLYYGYEHPWMLACAEQWRYDQAFLQSLNEAQRRFFHGFVFDPPEYRWG
jgi:ectoine hydroxylase-related dioxygenase (phytanoyl-CoA dioxygenase family)